MNKENKKRQKGLTLALAFLLLALYTMVAYANDPGTIDVIRKKEIQDQLVPEEPMLSTSSSMTPLNCRYGAAIGGNGGRNRLDDVSSGFFIDFTTANSSTASSKYVRQVRISQNLTTPWSSSNNVYDPSNYLQSYTIAPSLSALQTQANANPGSTWIIGNEPDRFRWQDDTHPDMYARAYHDAYFAIKSVDPTAQIATAALVQVSPGRLQYLDLVYAAYQAQYGTHMPVDIWTAHIYPLPEKNPDGTEAGGGIALGTSAGLAYVTSDLTASQCTDPNDGILCYSEHDDMTVVKNQIVSMRQWMKNHGYQNTPLMLTEIGILYPEFYSGGSPFNDEFGNRYTPARVSNYLTNVTTYLETATDSNLGYPLDNNKLVQQWVWFGMNFTNVGSVSNLIKNNWATYADGDLNALTPIGQQFLTEATNQGLNNNLFVETSYGTSGSGQVALTARVRNNGNTSVFTSLDVTFYSDAAKSNVIGSATINPVLHGCATSVHSATVNWTPSGSGIQQFWVSVDSGGAVSESNEADNGGTGYIFANPTSQILLPIINRQ